MTIGPTCRRCGRIHTSRDAYAVGRFNPAGSSGYRAVYPGSPLRETRAQAEADLCAHRQEATR